MENFERKQEKFDGKFQKKEWKGYLMENFKRKNATFDGKFQKKELDI